MIIFRTRQSKLFGTPGGNELHVMWILGDSIVKLYHEVLLYVFGSAYAYE